MDVSYQEEYFLFLSKSERYCVSCERSVSMVRAKLFEWGADDIMVSRILENLMERGFVNDRRFAEAFCQSKVRYQRWGKHKIVNALLQKGVSFDIVTQVIGEVDCESYESAILSLAKRKWDSLSVSDERKRREKVVAYLVSRGYSLSESFEALDEIKALKQESIKQ